MRLLARKASLAGFAHAVIEESDAPYSSQVMAIGFVPTKKYPKEGSPSLKDFLKDLPLLS